MLGKGVGGEDVRFQGGLGPLVICWEPNHVYRTGGVVHSLAGTRPIPQALRYSVQGCRQKHAAFRRF